MLRRAWLPALLAFVGLLKAGFVVWAGAQLGLSVWVVATAAAAWAIAPPAAGWAWSRWRTLVAQRPLPAASPRSP